MDKGILASKIEINGDLIYELSDDLEIKLTNDEIIDISNNLLHLVLNAIIDDPASDVDNKAIKGYLTDIIGDKNKTIDFIISTLNNGGV